MGKEKHASARRHFGDRAELFVVQELISRGFIIREQNYQRRYGEIDIIATKKELLVFVEVKVRRTLIEHMPAIVTTSKQRKIALVAREYISRYSVTDKICRFDVALVQANGQQMHLQYIENAFSATY